MALVTVTYNAWDHNRQVVPAGLKPEVWFRPIKSSLASGMMTAREVKGTLNASTGAGEVRLETGADLLYVPFMRWLSDPSQADEQVEKRSYGYCEWEPIYPAAGGPISELPGVVKFSAFYYGLGEPPWTLRKRDDVVYIDITGANDGFWQPWVPQGTYVEGVA
jgi:hypothetical protein